MYIQLLEPCNMTCAHCCVSATTKGRTMTLEVYKKALKIAREYDEYLTLGGGEPTMHPQFELFLMLAIANSECDEYAPCVITNGKLTERALLVARLTKKGVVQGQLSVDEFHDPVDPRVYQAFGKNTRDNSAKLIRVGRAVELYDQGYKPKTLYGYDPRDVCQCDDWYVQPDGVIHQCGCPDSPVIGNVSEGVDDFPERECYRSVSVSPLGAIGGEVGEEAA